MNITTILGYLKNPTIQRIALLITIFILAVLLFKGCGRTPIDNEKTQLEQNLAYYKDSLKIVKNKLNETEYQRSTLAIDFQNLKVISTELADEVAKEKGTVITLTKIIADLKIEIGTLQGNGTTIIKVWPNGEQSIYYNFDTTYSKGNELCFYSETRLGFKDTLIHVNFIDNKISFRVNIITGLQEDPKTKLLNIFVRSDYPGFEISGIDGALIDPQKSTLIKSYFPQKKFGLGFNLGVGLNAGKDGIVRIGPYVGVGVSYNLFNF